MSARNLPPAEFEFTSGCFNLEIEEAEDGARIQTSLDQARQALQEQERQQLKLPAVDKPEPKP